ncbi:MAG: alanine--glyoxylate aminotransferase family protein [Deltaproteobacteria bacterium TMED58]|nr:alanine--glyoxylate aminotransferase family protein [Deltaproteobacteria bacterium TMED58]
MLKNYVLTPGPVPVPEFVMLEMAKPIIHHRTEEFEEIFYKATQGLKKVFMTEEEVLILASSGTGAMDAAICNTLSKGDTALVVNGGKFGERWLKICKAYGVNTIEIKVEWGKAVSPKVIEDALKENKSIKAILVQASETSTGVEHPIEDIAKLTKSRDDIILIVDGITAVGAFPVEFDKWGIDILIGGSQKAFMMPPGLAFIVLSKKAWDFNDKSDLPKFYLDLSQAHKNSLKKTSPWTPAVTLVIGLNAVLEYFEKLGLEKLFERHSILSEATTKGFEAMGLENFAKGCTSTALSVIKSPEGIDAGLIIKGLKKKYGMIVAGGQDQAKGKIFRITHMGYVDKADIISVIAGVEGILTELKYKFEPGSGVAKATQILDKL